MDTAMTSISSSDYLLCTMLASREMSDETKKKRRIRTVTRPAIKACGIAVSS